MAVRTESHVDGWICSVFLQNFDGPYFRFERHGADWRLESEYAWD